MEIFLCIERSVKNFFVECQSKLKETEKEKNGILMCGCDLDAHQDHSHYIEQSIQSVQEALHRQILKRMKS